MTETKYPYASGDVTVLGPQCFIDKDETVINYRGENFYTYKSLPVETERGK